MIRLGSLAGYPFEGPRVLAGWVAPPVAAVYAVLVRDDERRAQEFAVIHVGHADDLSAEGFPFRHRAAPAWTRRAGDRYRLHVAYYVVPGGLASHREVIARELIAVYRPSCNDEQYDHAWRDEWIGGYSAAPTTAPLTTDRDPNA